MKKSMFVRLALISLCIVYLGFINQLNANPKKPNVLFIICDDLRPQINSFGQKQMITPNMDKLASQGVIFSRAYCQVPVCGASRASLLSGVRPNEIRFSNAASDLSKDMPSAISMPETFKKGGYKTYSIGKVFHNTTDNDKFWDFQTKFSHLDYQDSFAIAERERVKSMKKKGLLAGLAYESPDVPDSVYTDGQSALTAARIIDGSKASAEPFFLAVGFVRPHLPFNAPKKYWDMFNRDSIALAPNPFAPKDCPAEAIGNFAELRQMYLNMPKSGPVVDSLALTLIHGYYAATAYLDAQIGVVMDALKTSGQLENTIVVLIGDHGWFLGEHGLWCKHANFHLALNAPLIISAPGYKTDVSTSSIAEFVDIYPTLCDLTKIKAPAQLQGVSLTPILKNPSKQVKSESYSRYRNGETIITKDYAYTAWFKPQSETIISRMLYNLNIDINENTNIAEKPENRALVESLHQKVLNSMRQNKSAKGSEGVTTNANEVE